MHLLANPQAHGGRVAPTIDRTEQAFSDRGVQVCRVDAEDGVEAEQAAARLVAEGAERLVVIGGDGMVNLAAQAVAESSTVLAVLPFGSGNDFARGVGLPTEVEPAVDAALADPVAIDLMRIGERWAVSVATLGFSVAVNRRANTMRHPSGSAKYTVATMLELRHLHAEPFTLTVDGEERRRDAVLVTVANTSTFGGGMKISPAADPADGVLDLTLVGDTGRLQLLAWFRKVFDGSHLDHPMVETYRGRRISITSPATELWADGEPLGATPVTVEAVPGALLLAGATGVAQ